MICVVVEQGKSIKKILREGFVSVSVRSVVSTSQRKKLVLIVSQPLRPARMSVSVSVTVGMVSVAAEAVVHARVAPTLR